MSAARREFLEALFGRLEEQKLPYCVQRNYAHLLDADSSDVDLLIEPENLGHLEDALRQTATRTGHNLLLRTRFVNTSFVYWRPDGPPLRIDADTELRWRFFGVLPAVDVLRSRRKFGWFYVPDPAHESLILFLAAVWLGSISDRYRARLAELHLEAEKSPGLRQLLVAAFGAVGNQMAEYQAHAREEGAAPAMCAAARRALVAATLRNPAKLGASLALLGTDASRWIGRMRCPPGLSVLYAGGGIRSEDLGKIVDELDPLWPKAKSAWYCPRPGGNTGGGWKTRFRRFRCLFRGGLFLMAIKHSTGDAFRKTLRAYAGWARPRRSLVCFASDTRLWLANLASGFMSEAPLTQGIGSSLLRFLSSSPATSDLSTNAARRGQFLVLVGLDGSGKTTVARSLCALPTIQQAFVGIRYFHWLPPLTDRFTLPLPDTDLTPRKPPMKRSVVNTILSCTRLLKSLVQANASYLLTIRPRLQRGALIVSDRYFYNYYLDPDSVRFSGPAWLLERLCRWFPRPDLVAVLTAPGEVLRARKPELSSAEVERQQALLANLPVPGEARLELDATAPPEATATRIAQALIRGRETEPRDGA